jgi:hypothetical protein
MRKGNSITVYASRSDALTVIIRDRNSPQKQVWRARIIVLTADSEGNTAVMRAVGKPFAVEVAGRLDVPARPGIAETGGADQRGAVQFPGPRRLGMEIFCEPWRRRCCNC